jgi:hypothetical protein
MTKNLENINFTLHHNQGVIELANFFLTITTTSYMCNIFMKFRFSNSFLNAHTALNKRWFFEGLKVKGEFSPDNIERYSFEKVLKKV